MGQNSPRRGYSLLHTLPTKKPHVDHNVKARFRIQGRISWGWKHLDFIFQRTPPRVEVVFDAFFTVCINQKTPPPFLKKNQLYLVTVMCWIVHPFPNISLAFHWDGPNGGLGCRSGWHVKFHVHIADKTGRHFPIRAELQVAEETVRMTRSYEKRRLKLKADFETRGGEPPLRTENWINRKYSYYRNIRDVEIDTVG